MHHGIVVRMFHWPEAADLFCDALRQRDFDAADLTVVQPGDLPQYGRGEHAAGRGGGVMERLSKFFRGEESAAPESFVDFLTDRGVSRDDAERYEEDVRAGSTMVLVRAGDRASEVESLRAADLLAATLAADDAAPEAVGEQPPAVIEEIFIGEVQDVVLVDEGGTLLAPPARNSTAEPAPAFDPSDQARRDALNGELNADESERRLRDEPAA